MVNSRTRKTKTRAGRRPTVERQLPRLRNLGIFNIKDALALGISQPSLSRLVAAQKIERLAPGIYMHPQAGTPPEERDYIVACKLLGPDSVIGGLTALHHYGLIEQIPSKLWVLLPHERRTPRSLYRCIRTKTNPRVGVVDHGHYRIVSLERSLVEALRYSTKIGLRTALLATRKALADKRTTLDKIHATATALKLERFVQKYWEAIVPEGFAA